MTVITLILSSAGVLGHSVRRRPARLDGTVGAGGDALGAADRAAARAPAAPAGSAGAAAATAAARHHRRDDRGDDGHDGDDDHDDDDDRDDAETTTTEKTGSDGQHVKWTVKPGDTLGSIATQFGTSVRALQRLNPSIDPDALQIGQEIVVR